MIGAVARRSLREILRDGRFRWLAMGCGALIAVAVLNGFQLTVAQSRDVTAAAAADRANFVQQGARNPHAAAHFGQYAFRPILLPAAVDPGFGEYMGTMVWLEAHRMNLPEFRPAEDGTSAHRGAQLSVAWVLQFLLPLLVVVVSFGAVAGERERGTLALAASHGLTMSGFLLGKTVATLLALALVIVPALLLCLALFVWAAPGVEHSGGLPRLLLMGIAYTLYIGGFAGLSLWISVRSSSSRRAFFILIGLWLAITVVIPRIAADTAITLHPTPSETAFWESIKRGDGGALDIQDQRARIGAIRQQTLQRELARYNVDTADELPINFTAVFLQALEEADGPIFDFNFGQLWEVYESQRKVQQAASLLSPAIAVRSVSAAMAGADPFAQRHFSMAAEEYRRQFVGELNTLQAVDGAGKRFYVAGPDTWQDIDAFRYQPPATRQVLARHVADLAVLVIWSLLPLGLGLASARRASVLP